MLWNLKYRLAGEAHHETFSDFWEMDARRGHLSADRGVKSFECWPERK